MYLTDPNLLNDSVLHLQYVLLEWSKTGLGQQKNSYC